MKALAMVFALIAITTFSNFSGAQTSMYINPNQVDFFYDSAEGQLYARIYDNCGKEATKFVVVSNSGGILNRRNVRPVARAVENYCRGLISAAQANRTKLEFDLSFVGSQQVCVPSNIPMD